VLGIIVTLVATLVVLCIAFGDERGAERGRVADMTRRR